MGNVPVSRVSNAYEDEDSSEDEGSCDDGYEDEGSYDDGYEDEDSYDDGYEDEDSYDDGYEDEDSYEDGYEEERGYEDEDSYEDGYEEEGGYEDDTDGSSDDFAMQSRTNQRSQQGKEQHFDSGEYEFRKEVLGWSFNRLDSLRQSLTQYSIISSKISSSGYSGVLDDYYEQYKPFIMEEARAIIEQGYQEYRHQNLRPNFFTFKNDVSMPKNEGNPSSVAVSGTIPKEIEARNNIVVLLIPKQGENRFDYDLELLTLARVDENDHVSLKFILDADKPLAKKYMKRRQEWKGYILGALINCERMYTVCHEKPYISFARELLTGVLSKCSGHDPSNATFARTALNVEQQKSIQPFVNASTGLYAIQGPPGTGKTTMLVEGIAQTSLSQKVLVCAPSNKAVHEVAGRFLEKHGNVRIAYLGVDKRIPEALRPVFIHKHKEYFVRQYSHVIEWMRRSKKQSSKNPGFLHALARKLLAIKQSHDNYASNKIKSPYLKFYSFVNIMIDSDEFRDQKEIKKWEQAIDKVVGKLEECRAQVNKIDQRELEEAMLSEAQVIFCTLTTAGRKSMRECLSKVDALFIDEAGQAVEAEVCIPFLYQPNKCLLVGDTKQLPATVISGVAKQKNFAWSMLWRITEINKQQASMLCEQYRMHPEIRQWPSKIYYDNQLREGSNIVLRANRPFTSSFPSCVYLFIDVPGKEERFGSSYKNSKESEVARYLVDSIVSKEKGSRQRPTIGVITFYSGQVGALEYAIDGRGKDLRISTVDGFQGGECDYIIISMVRANKDSRIGFVEDFRRLNVAITRAKYGLVILGNAKTLENSTEENGEQTDVAKLVRDAKERGRFCTSNQLRELLKPPATYPLPKLPGPKSATTKSGPVKASAKKPAAPRLSELKPPVAKSRSGKANAKKSALPKSSVPKSAITKSSPAKVSAKKPAAPKSSGLKSSVAKLNPGAASTKKPQVPKSSASKSTGTKSGFKPDTKKSAATKHSVVNSASSGPSKDKVAPPVPNSKTKLCRFYQSKGSCNIGDKCNFAHGENELRKATP